MNPPTRQLLTLLSRFAKGDYVTTDSVISVAVESYEAGYKDARDMEAKASQVPAGTALSAILAALKDGNKIQAIKVWRTVTGGGLKEGKDFVEAICEMNRVGGF